MSEYDIHSHPAEITIVGSLFLEPPLLNSLIEKVDIERFESPFREIVQAIKRIFLDESDRFDEVSVLTVWEVLKSMGKDRVVQKRFLREIEGNIVSTKDFNDSVQIIADRHIREDLEEEAVILESMIQEEMSPIDEIIARLDKLRNTTDESYRRLSRRPTLSNYMDRIDARLERVIAAKGQITGVPSGFYRVDALTGGFQDEEFIIIAGRPSMGKTALAVDICRNNIKYYNRKPAFFSYEMSTELLLTRMMAPDANVSVADIRQGKISEEDRARFQKVRKTYEQEGLFLIEDELYPLDVLCSRIETAVRTFGAEIIFVDYLQLIPVKGRSREEEVAEISSRLNALKKRLKVPIVALSQLNRAVTKRNVKRPDLTDLRESGALEQDADVVVFVHRPWYYTREDTDKSGKDIKHLAEIILAKQRNGPVGLAEIRFDPEMGQFSNPTQKWSQVRR